MMSRHIRNGFLGLAFSIAINMVNAPGGFAEVVAVPQQTSNAGAPPQTFTLYWPAVKADATLVLIPGGNGHIGISPARTSLANPFYLGLKRLSDPGLSKGNINVVIFDSPYEMDPNSRSYPSGRATDDHLSRIDAVVKFYEGRTGKPVFLMGHSNGAVSVTEYVRYLQRKQAGNTIRGLILSSTRNGTFLNAPIDLPVMFLHHEKDGCRDSTLEASEKLYQSVRPLNQSGTDFQLVSTGEAQSGFPCNSGYHMFFRADEEVSQRLEAFILANLNYTVEPVP